MAQEAGKAEEVKQICCLLTPPLFLASFDSWLLPQGETEDDRQAATDRVKAVSRWVEQDVPALLRRLHHLITSEYDEKSELDIELKSFATVAAAVFVSPRRKPNGMDESLRGREPWITPTNSQLAIDVLQSLSGQEKSRGADSVAVEGMTVTHILTAYLKPIFSCTPSKNVDPATGRATRENAKFNSGDAAPMGEALMDDEIMWKGGDIKNSATVTVLGQSVLFKIHGENGNPLHLRHRALGSFNVLYICCCSVQSLHESGRISWEEYWPFLLPPLLSVMEDPSPLYRLLGTRILNTTLLSGQKTSSAVGSLLLRTGVATLLRQILFQNLTFISTRYAAALLQSSAESLLRVSQTTTAPLQADQPVPLYINRDGGKQRFEQLGSLVDEGILRVWAYAPASISVLDEVEEDQVHSQSKQQASADEEEPSDVIDTSIALVTRMTHSDALGVCMARYLDVLLDFLTAQLLGLEARLIRHREGKRSSIVLAREIASAEAIVSLLEVCTEAPGVKTWSSRCVDAVARCWTLLQDRREDEQTQVLFEHLHKIVNLLHAAQPHLMQQILLKLASLDDTLFSPLYSTLF